VDPTLARNENVVQFLVRSGRFLEQHVGTTATTQKTASNR
jgi:hypothetical protein